MGIKDKRSFVRYLKFLVLFWLVLLVYLKKNVIVSYLTYNENFESDFEIIANSNNQKFIQYECTTARKLCGGWADRLKGIMSTYALSQLLNRTFLMKITQPCHLNTLIKPNAINWNRKLPTKSIYNFKIYYDYDQIKEFETLELNKLLKRFDDYELINIRAGIMFSDAFKKNPSARAAIERLGYDPDKFQIKHQIHRWYGELFRLAPKLTFKFDLLKQQAKPNSNTFLICVQLRIGGQTANNYSDNEFTKRSNTLKYWKFINDTFLNKLSSYVKDGDLNNYRIYVTSDHENIKQEARDVFSEGKVVFNKDPSAHMDLDYTFTNSNCGNIENVIIDFHLLQFCDAAVVSHSGFGILGAWNRPEPSKNFYVYTNPDQERLKVNYRDRSNLDFIKINDLDQDLYFI